MLYSENNYKQFSGRIIEFESRSFKMVLKSPTTSKNFQQTS